MSKEKASKKNILILIIIVVAGATMLFFLNHKTNLIYLKDESYLNSFYFEDEYIVFDCSIKIKNISSKSYSFYMDADFSNETGLTKGKIAVGYDKETNQKTFYIKENSEMNYSVKFKTLKGEKTEKDNRLPPENIIITEQNKN